MGSFLLIASNRWVQLAAAGVVILLLLARLAWVGSDLEKAQLEVKTSAAAVATCVETNEDNTETVAELRKDIEKLTLQRATEASEREAVLAERSQEVEAAQRVAAVERRKRHELFRSTQSCEGLANLRVDLACPAIADRLRERSQGGGPD